MQRCLSEGANIEARNNQGATPLYIAAQNGHLEMAQYLVEHGAKVNLAMKAGWTPLYIAAANGHLETVQCLVGHQAAVVYTHEVGDSMEELKRALQTKSYQTQRAIQAFTLPAQSAPTQ